MKSVRASEFLETVDDRNRFWALQDRLLYDLCVRVPAHGKVDEVCAKVSIIGRTYATGIERQISSDGTAASSLTQLALALHRRHEQVDAILARLGELGLELSEEALAVIVVEHKRFIDILKEDPGTKKTPRSFASKYLHFHSPVVPVFDSRAQKGVQRVLPWGKHRNSFVELPAAPGVDEEYRDYCRQFWGFYCRLQKVGVAASVKEVDYYLMTQDEVAS